MAVNLLRMERLSVDFMEDIQDLMHTTFVKWQAKNDIHLQQDAPLPNRGMYRMLAVEMDEIKK